MRKNHPLFHYSLIIIVVAFLQISIPFAKKTTNAEYEMFTPGRLVYVIQDWSKVSGNSEVIGTTMKVNCPSAQVTEYYWGTQFVFNEGNIGWFGMTSSCMGLGGNGFVFTICDGISAEPGIDGYLSKSIEPGNGLSCVLPYKWKNGVEYSFILSRCPSKVNSDTISWDLNVTEKLTNDTIFVGCIETKSNWATFYKWSTQFVEYFGPILDCETMPRGSIYFGPVKVNNSEILPNKNIWKTSSCDSKTEIDQSNSEKLYIKTGSKY
ncbi:MAG: DUF3472 domain-containing protein [Caldisericia bacterium]|nr:DUF3472 domain-containing protein [Caldisericia bacterium]